MGYVYLILEVDKDGSEGHKIGITKNEPTERLRNLQTGNPRSIRVLKLYESSNYIKVEGWLHKKFASQVSETEKEWFVLTNEQVFGFEDICKEADKTISFLKENNPFYK